MLLPWPLLLGTCCFMLLLPPDLAGQGQHKIKRNTRWLAWLLMEIEIEIEIETEIALLLNNEQRTKKQQSDKRF
jgi:hypothetical protein